MSNWASPATMAAMGGGRGVDFIRSFPIRPPPSRRSPARNSLPSEDANPRQSDTLLRSKTPRRDALLFLTLPALLHSLAVFPSTAAFSIGIPGPKEWLRDQKKKAARFVLAPIEYSLESLRNAYLLLSSEAGSPVEDSGEVRRLLDSAVRDCVPQRRSSVVDLQSRTGVEVCTYRLLLKNAASLLDEGDPVKLEAEAMLSDLIRSFSLLGNVIDNSNFELATDRQKVKDVLKDTISSLDKFEQGIKDCLGV